MQSHLREELTPGLVDFSLKIFIQQKVSTAKPIALKGLGNENWMVRRSSVEFLGSVTPGDSERLLGQALAMDPNISVRIAAVFSLQKVGTDLEQYGKELAVFGKNINEHDFSENAIYDQHEVEEIIEKINRLSKFKKIELDSILATIYSDMVSIKPSEQLQKLGCDI